MTSSFTVATQKRSQMIAIHAQIQTLVNQAGVKEGTAVIYVPHTTAGITINENYDPDVVTDTLHALDKIVPWDDPAYRHSEGNTAAHIKTAMFGTSATVFIENGRLALGQWQGIFLCEFDGPRTRTVWVKWQSDV
jgi:secondary thiamine-phosphate synthase enzyme